MVKVKLIITVILGFFYASWLSAETPYQAMQTFCYATDTTSANYYVFNRKEKSGGPSRQLFIFLDGGSKLSVLGKKTKEGWERVSFGYLLDQYLLPDTDLLLLEHIHLGAGEDYRSLTALSEDNFQNKLEIYTGIIDEFLTFHPKYRNVIFMGYSEGGLLVPKIYTQLETKFRISALILCASGGESLYKSLTIQKESTLPFNTTYRTALNTLEEAVTHIRKDPYNTEKFYFGWPYLRWAYFLSYRPIDDLLNISVPILILHGEKDLNIPVESARNIVEAFYKQGKTNYLYREYRHVNHFFDGQFHSLIKDINTWISSEMTKPYLIP